MFPNINLQSIQRHAVKKIILCLFLYAGCLSLFSSRVAANPPETENPKPPLITTQPHRDGTVTETVSNEMEGGRMITWTHKQANGQVIKTEKVFRSNPGQGKEGSMAGVNGEKYGKTHEAEDGSGYTEILGANGQIVGGKFFGASMASDDSPRLKGTVWDMVPKGGSWTPMADGSQVIRNAKGNIVKTIPPPGKNAVGSNTPVAANDQIPAVGNTAALQERTSIINGGVMSSTQQADRTWKHHYYRKDSEDGTVVSYDVLPTDDLYPHDNPLFWPPGASTPGRFVKSLPVNDPSREERKIISTRNPDGTWTHRFYKKTEMGVVNYELEPDDELYPKDDPRFAPLPKHPLAGSPAPTPAPNPPPPRETQAESSKESEKSWDMETGAAAEEMAKKRRQELEKRKEEIINTWDETRDEIRQDDPPDIYDEYFDEWERELNSLDKELNELKGPKGIAAEEERLKNAIRGGPSGKTTLPKDSVLDGIKRPLQFKDTAPPSLDQQNTPPPPLPIGTPPDLGPDKKSLPDKPSPSPDSILDDLDKGHSPVDETNKDGQTPEAQKTGNPVFRKAAEEADACRKHILEHSLMMDKRFGIIGARETLKGVIKTGDKRILEDILAWSLPFIEAWQELDKIMYSPPIKELAETKAILGKEHEDAARVIDHLQTSMQAWDTLEQKIQGLFDQALNLAAQRAKLWEKHNQVSDEFSKKFHEHIGDEYKGDRVKRAEDLRKKADREHNAIEDEIAELNRSMRKVFIQIKEAGATRPSFATEETGLTLPKKFDKAGKKPLSKEAEEAQKKMERACGEARQTDGEAVRLEIQAENAQKDVDYAQKKVNSYWESKEQAKWEYEEAEEAAKRAPSAESTSRVNQLRREYEVSQSFLKKSQAELLQYQSQLAIANSKMQEAQKRADEVRQDCERRKAAFEKLTQGP